MYTDNLIMPTIGKNESYAQVTFWTADDTTIYFLHLRGFLISE